MKSRDFFIISIIVIAIVAGIVSYISILYLMKPLLLANQQGYLNLGTLGSGTISVIVVDTTVTAGILDTVTFTGVARGVPGTPNTYKTDLSTATSSSPWPFLLRNIGSEIAKVQIYYDSGTCTEPTAGTLFCSTNSYVKFWVEQAACEVGTTTAGWGCNAAGNKVITCGANGCFTTATTCSDYAGPCDTEANSKNLPFTNANKKIAIQDLKPVATGKNEAIVHVKIGVDYLEPQGTKSATFYIVATQGP